ncbi:MAG TPA: hypothetical protein VKE88_02620 [Candidatus Nanoarchaeia archaeon]|nr:hypothetical protein [Candidatus Nanoarchaeia archaeon]
MRKIRPDVEDDSFDHELDLFGKDGKLKQEYQAMMHGVIRDVISKIGIKELARESVLNKEEYRTILRLYGKDFCKGYLAAFDQELQTNNMLQLKLQSLPSTVHVMKVIEIAVGEQIGSKNDLETTVTKVLKERKDILREKKPSHIEAVIGAKLQYGYEKVIDGIKRTMDWRKYTSIPLASKKKDDVYPI